MSIEVGNVIPGKVTGITNFGVFVDLGDRKTGLVHISEVSDSYIQDIKEVLKVGDEVKVKVMTIADDGKISLSIRRAVDKPKEDSADKPRAKKPFTHVMILKTLRKIALLAELQLHTKRNLLRKQKQQISIL